ncbi:hypothetical protein AKJ09_07769 [Labilithrix luteola]|uniref:Type IV fimbrial biogenesis protein PilY1 n=1 Tax=Labilithrix luteola TaxID=1391654 RepID=A0A0K1Q5K3_9BACT|nr:hypothetical protein AKJ09_07769 [Labilithrix luteola]
MIPAMLSAFASCASTDSADSTPNSNSIIEAGTNDGADSGAGDASATDGGCDHTDPTCVTEVVTCDEADWCPVESGVNNFYALTTVWGSGKDDVWASGSGGSVVHWDGNRWAAVPVPSTTSVPIRDTLRALWGSGPNDVWLAASTNVIFHSNGFANGTASWVRVPSVPMNDSDVPVYAAWGTTADDVRFGGGPFNDQDNQLSNQFLKKPSSADIEWTTEGGLSTIHGYWGSSADDLWLVADGRPYEKLAGQTMHGTRKDGAFVWTPVDSRAAVVLRGLWGSSPNDVWTVGDHGTIRHLGANASTATEWEIVESPTSESLHGVWGSGPNDVWVIGDNGTIFHWDGAAWKPSIAAFPVNRKKPNLYGIWGSGPKDVWIVGDDIVIHLGEHLGGTK